MPFTAWGERKFDDKILQFDFVPTKLTNSMNALKFEPLNTLNAHF